MLDKLLNWISFKDRFATFETLSGLTLVIIAGAALFVHITGLLVAAVGVIDTSIPYVAIPLAALGWFLILRNRAK